MVMDTSGEFNRKIIVEHRLLLASEVTSSINESVNFW